MRSKILARMLDYALKPNYDRPAAKREASLTVTHLDSLHKKPSTQ
ncbi:hypothetical protein HOV93_46810 [Planctomycetes bacterium FF15]|uniref:Uncharacterized protein n=1 Tax=Bremerella alba TaxID=980252 RepID=A0A7V9A9I2_9BACT|nr:hypothetical protein [Bremerella alba]